MGIILKRGKPRNYLLTFIYRFSKLPFLNKKNKFILFLNLEWIFDRLAHEYSFKHYSFIQHPNRIYSKQFMLRVINSESTILDLGSGNGDVSNMIADYARLVVGIDHNPEKINYAKHKYKKTNLEFVHMEARDYLINNPNKFDVLILSHVLEHLDNPQEFLLQFKSYFKYIFIEIPDFDKNYLNHYRKDLGMSLIYSDPDHVSEFDRYEAEQILNDCNLQIIHSEYRFGIQKLWCKIV